MEIILSDVSKGPIKNINMCAFNGKITAVVGNCNSGKTTLAKILSTLIKPDKGSYIINNKVINFDNPNLNYNKLRFDIGFVMQDIKSQIFEDTVYNQILYQLKIYNYKPTKKHIIDSLKMVGLNSSYIDRKISTLSDSERFKVMLSSALSINPKVLILDDPTCFLDKKEKDNLIKLLRIMKVRYKKTIVILTTDVNFILKVSDYVYVLDNYKLITHGDKYEVFKDKKIDKLGISIPDIMDFSYKFSKYTKTPMVKRDNTNDLIKDIYYYVEKKNRGKI